MYVPQPFVHRYPPLRVRYAPGLARGLAPLLQELGLARCLLVCGEHVGSSAWLRELVSGAGGRIAKVHAGVRPHAPVQTVDAVAEVARGLGVDGLISVGGGSAHDTARAAALCLRSGRTMLGHFPGDQSFVRDPPAGAAGPALVAVPSTFSAAETTFGGGVTHDGRKLVFVGESLYISDIVYDPEVFATTPRDTLLASGMNALNHAVERLLSPQHQPIADAQFLHALALLVPGLRRLAAAGGDDPEALAACILGAHLSESTNVLGGIGHAIAHVLGGRYGVSHGVANGIVMPRALATAAAGNGATIPAIASIAHTLGVPASGADLERALLELVSDLGLPTRLREIGVPRDDLTAVTRDTLADFSAAHASPGTSERSVAALLERAW